MVGDGLYGVNAFWQADCGGIDGAMGDPPLIGTVAVS